MKKSPSYNQNLQKLAYHANYLEDLENLPFQLEVDLEELPNDPDIESPVYKEEDFVNIRQMIALKK